MLDYYCFNAKWNHSAQSIGHIDQRRFGHDGYDGCGVELALDGASRAPGDRQGVDGASPLQ